MTSSFLPAKERYPFWVLAFILCAVTLLLYSVSLGHNFLFDEENIILNNPTIRSFAGVKDLLSHGYFYFANRGEPRWDEYYRPLTSFTFMLDYHFWGVNPLGYNLTNLAMHLILSVLYFAFLEALLCHRPAAFLAALLYAVHTMHTEAVTYTASRGDILGLLLMLAAMLFYAKRRVSGALVCYFFALFSKETMIMLPVYIVFLDIAFVRSRGAVFVRRIAPFFALMAAFWVFRRFFCPIPFAPLDPDFRGVLFRMLGMGDGILQYLRMLVAPEYFKPFSDVPELHGFADPLIWTAVTVAALLSAAWLLSLRYRGLAFLGMSIFLAGLAPHFQIIHVYPEWAEHFFCISSLGLFLLLGMLARTVWEGGRKSWAILFFSVYLPFFAFVSWRTAQRNELYNDPRRYYELLSQTDTPYRFFGYQQLALDSLREDRADEAYVPLKAALAEEFRSEATHQLMGLYYTQKKRPEEALKEFRLAFFYSGDNTIHLQQIGNTLIWLGRFEEAARAYAKAQRITPDSVAPYAQLMSAYELMGRDDLVRKTAGEALERFRGRPATLPTVLMAIARFDYRAGRLAEAKRGMEEILARFPDAPGTADLARLALGKMDARKFLGLTKTRYPHYKNAAPAFLLMADVLQGRKAEALVRLKSERKAILDYSKKNKLFVRDIWLAEKFVRGEVTF